MEYYSVELVLNDGALDKASIRTIEAASPLRAAEEAVGRPLSLHGNRPCAIVRWMNAAYVAFTVTIYDQQPTPVELSPSK